MSCWSPFRRHLSFRMLQGRVGIFVCLAVLTNLYASGHSVDLPHLSFFSSLSWGSSCLHRLSQSIVCFQLPRSFTAWLKRIPDQRRVLSSPTLLLLCLSHAQPFSSLSSGRSFLSSCFHCLFPSFLSSGAQPLHGLFSNRLSYSPSSVVLGYHTIFISALESSFPLCHYGSLFFSHYYVLLEKSDNPTLYF